MITPRDLEIAKLLKHNPSRAILTIDPSFSLAVFLYDKDEVRRQKEHVTQGLRITYEDHISVITTARYELKNETSLEIAKAILTHRYFKAYRANTFQGKGSFLKDLQFILQRIGPVYSHKDSKLITKDVTGLVKQFTVPTLVQVNHLASIVSPVTVPNIGKSLEDWAILFNKEAPESTVYVVAGKQAA